MIRPHVIWAIASRNLAQYFSGVLGYLFIGVFVTMCSLATFNQQFFAENLASLDQLSMWFPWLLLFLTPAITMSVWADERRQGTDALLFTLPASDLEILLGKFLSVTGVYGIALVFSLPQLVALFNLGQPDIGVLATTYLGYFLAGLALLAIGMFASSLTDSPTVAFVLGALMGAVPVVIGSYFSGNPLIESWGFSWHLSDFASGLVSASGICYFVGLIVLFLYLNLIVISKRQWRTTNSLSMWARYMTRFASLVVILGCLGYIVSANSTSPLTRLDLTKERAFSLDSVTKATLMKIRDGDHLVSVQAFVSDEVPREYVAVKKQFLGLLRQLSYSAGKNVKINVVSVTPNSEEAEQAERIGVTPQEITSDVGGKVVQQKVYVGAYLSSANGDALISKLEPQSSVEYELTRGLTTTTQREWKIKLGIVDTDAHFGGIMFRGERMLWVPYTSAMRQLQANYDILHIDQGDLREYVEGAVTIREAPDVLLVPDPSSLDTKAADALVKYIEAGHPVLILADPLPFYWTSRQPQELGIINAPRQPRISFRSPYAQQLASTMGPKVDGGTAERVFDAIGIRWDYDQVAWHLNNPHPNFSGWWPPYLGPTWPSFYGRYETSFVFVNQNDMARPAFNVDEAVSKYLREVLFIYPGNLAPKEGESKFEFVPLIQLGERSGLISWEKFTQKPMEKVQAIDPATRRVRTREEPIRSQITDDDLYVPNPNPPAVLDAKPKTIAARVFGKDREKNKANVLVIADLDFVSEMYYEQQEALKTPSLDNYRLLENAIEVLANKSDFVALRNRRFAPRSLTTFERMVSVYRQQRVDAESENRQQLDGQLQAARERLEKSLQSIDEDDTTSFIEKLQLSTQEAEGAQNRFDRERDRLEKELASKNQVLKAQESRHVRGLENWIRFVSVAFAPVPALLMGLVVLTGRMLRERREIRPERSV
ncbi:MAG: Gldg family protein [Pirellulaceae bacterium]|nr:Gldg family protein [Pirellulaceae bacterium]